MSEDEFNAYKLDPDVVAVVGGLDYDFTYRKLCIASLYVTENNATLIGSNPDRNSGSNRRRIPCGGCVIKAIETASGVKAQIMGKPFTYIFDLIRKQHGLENEPLSKFLMTGDNLQTDILFGLNNRIDTLLVLTGCTTTSKAERVVL